MTKNSEVWTSSLPIHGITINYGKSYWLIRKVPVPYSFRYESKNIRNPDVLKKQMSRGPYSQLINLDEALGLSTGTVNYLEFKEISC